MKSKYRACSMQSAWKSMIQSKLLRNRRLWLGIRFSRIFSRIENSASFSNRRNHPWIKVLPNASTSSKSPARKPSWRRSRSLRRSIGSRRALKSLSSELNSLKARISEQLRTNDWTRLAHASKPWRWTSKRIRISLSTWLRRLTNFKCKWTKGLTTSMV